MNANILVYYYVILLKGLRNKTEDEYHINIYIYIYI